MLCLECALWSVRDDDNYCSWCGHKFISLDLEIRPSRFAQGDLPPPAQLTIVNSSSRNEVVVQSIRSTVSWLTVDLREQPLPFTLGPRKSERLKVEIAALDIEEEYASGRLVVTSNAGFESVEVEIVPPPEVYVTTGEYEIFLDNRDLERTFVSVEVTRGVLTLTGVTAEPAEWVSVRPVEEVCFPLTLDSRGTNTLELRLMVNEEYLLANRADLPAEYVGAIRLKGLDFEREEPFVVRCWNPPQMWIWEESDPRVTAYVGKRGELTLSIQNKMPGDPLAGRGNAPLEVHSLEVRNADGSPNAWLRPADKSEGPVRIEGGGLRQFRFAFDTEGSGAEGAPAASLGRHFVVLTIGTNLYEPTRDVRMEVNVVRLPVFDGVLAVDFGTSNTCCAVLGRRQDRFAMLDIDSPQHNPRPTTAPTLIQYCDLLPSGEKLVEIGALVEARYSDPRVVGSTVRSPKRHLGRTEEADRFEIRFFYNAEKQASYAAREVVADYLAKVRLVAEQHGRGQFRRIIITHPARFRINQLRDLEAAVREAFGAQCEISTLQEPVAAALDFIVSEEALANDGYTLGVFDFGGGTTDLSLLRVDNLRTAGFTEIRACLNSSTGKWFGGEDVTGFVMRYGLERCQAIARQVRGRTEILTEARQTSDWNQSWLARVNQSRMLRWAELTKLLLVEHGDDHEIHLPALPDIFPMIRLNVFAPSGVVEEMAFPHLEIVPRQQELYAFLEDELAKLAKLLAGLAARTEHQDLNYVLLSGKSSVIPLVREVLSREFPASTVRIAAEPKECVVSGACILEKFQHAQDMFLSIVGTEATTSRIGMEDVGPGGTKIFREWIAAGVPIPEGGLSCSRPFLIQGKREIRLLENDGEEDALWILGKENKNVAELGIYVLEQVPDWLPQNRPVPGVLELGLDPHNLQCELVARAEGHPETLRFVRKAAG